MLNGRRTATFPYEREIRGAFRCHLVIVGLLTKSFGEQGTSEVTPSGEYRFETIKIFIAILPLCLIYLPYELQLFQHLVWTVGACQRISVVSVIIKRGKEPLHSEALPDAHPIVVIFG